MYIYRLISPSGKSYVGQSKDYKNRIKWHFKGVTGKKISNAVKKYGEENFDVEILAEGIEDRDLLDLLEIYWIDFLDSYKNGYNMTKGGDGIDSETQSNLKLEFYQTERGLEERKRRSEAFSGDRNPGKKLKGKPAWNRGIPQTEEHKSKRVESWLRGHDSNRSKRFSDRTKKAWENGAYDNRPKPSKESISKGIQTKQANGFRQSDHQKQTVSSIQKSTYLIEWADGRTEEFKGLKEFSERSKIPYDTLMAMKNRGSKKWGVKNLTLINTVKRTKNHVI